MTASDFATYHRVSMPPLFISGSLSIRQLPARVMKRLSVIIDKELPVVIGDAPGADAAVQRFFADCGVRHVTIFCGGSAPGIISAYGGFSRSGPMLLRAHAPSTAQKIGKCAASLAPGSSYGTERARAVAPTSGVYASAGGMSSSIVAPRTVSSPSSAMRKGWRFWRPAVSADIAAA